MDYWHQFGIWDVVTVFWKSFYVVRRNQNCFFKIAVSSICPYLLLVVQALCRSILLSITMLGRPICLCHKSLQTTIFMFNCRTMLNPKLTWQHYRKCTLKRNVILIWVERRNSWPIMQTCGTYQISFTNSTMRMCWRRGKAAASSSGPPTLCQPPKQSENCSLGQTSFLLKERCLSQSA